MNGNGPISNWARAFLAMGLIFLVTTPTLVVAQQRPPAVQDGGDDDESNGDGRKYKPMPVNPEVFNAHDEWFVATARKIQDGTAKTIERRAWYEMKKRYYPFTPDAIPPRDWRIRAFEQAKTLDPVASQMTVLGPRRLPSVALTRATTEPTESEGMKSVSTVQVAASFTFETLVLFQSPPSAKPRSTSRLSFGFTQIAVARPAP